MSADPTQNRAAKPPEWKPPLIDRLICKLGLHLFMPDGTCCVCRVSRYRDE